MNFIFHIKPRLMELISKNHFCLIAVITYYCN